MSGGTVIPFPPRPFVDPLSVEPEAWRAASPAQRADMVAHQLLHIARTLCFQDEALTDDAIRRAAEIVGPAAPGVA